MTYLGRLRAALAVPPGNAIVKTTPRVEPPSFLDGLKSAL
eukprot:CAMPEP_0173282974 /NCGR_PEP_ID=MMETSP1143-20121109/7127_1 /TAXON_ID=483371 /ORGANISM="non described non described, Strain CCMP2298" /LENGTH=39 /DNA_ID= /DNA_START= /DNA_END= /DNA_ORIENTATION=